VSHRLRACNSRVAIRFDNFGYTLLRQMCLITINFWSFLKTTNTTPKIYINKCVLGKQSECKKYVHLRRDMAEGYERVKEGELDDLAGNDVETKRAWVVVLEVLEVKATSGGELEGDGGASWAAVTADDVAVARLQASDGAVLEGLAASSRV